MKILLLIFSLLFVNPIYSQWEKFPNLLNNDLFDIQAVDNGNNIFVVGTDSLTSTSKGIIYKSTNSGFNWDTVYYHEVDNFLGILYRINLVNADIGYVTNSGSRVYKTIDGGLTWDTLSIPTASAGPATDAIFFINSEIGFIGNYYGEIFKTMDGGLTWEEVHSLQPFSPIYDINCPTMDTCYARTANPSFLKSIDSGNTWNPVSSVPHTSILGGMHVLNKDTIVLVSSEGVILRSINAGENFDTIPSPVNAGLLDVHFKDNLGFAVGRKETILKSEDYGATWTTEHFDSTSYEWIKAIHISNSELAFACSNDGSIFRLETSTSTNNTLLKTDKINIFPNPFSSHFTIQFEHPKNGLIEIYNSQGQQLQRIKILSQKEVQIDLSGSNLNFFFLSFLEKGSNFKTIRNIMKAR